MSAQSDHSILQPAPNEPPVVLDQVPWNTLKESLSLLSCLEGKKELSSSPPIFSPSRNIVHRATDDQAFAIGSNAIPPRDGRPLESVLEDARHIFSYRSRTGHPRFLGFIPSPALPVSWVGDVITSAYNTFAGSAEAASGVFEVERTLVSWLSTQLGLPSDTAGGHFVSGSSIATLTGVTVARDHLLNTDMRHRGVAYISDQAHFSVAKALRIIGCTSDQIRVIPSDNDCRFSLADLRSTILQDVNKGLRPFLVVATCGTTSTGAVDPIIKLADIAKDHHMWLHIDAAYGASVALSSSHRHWVEGLGRADSISWDAHKWLFQTYGCGLVLFRNNTLALKSFSGTGEYVRDVEGLLESRSSMDIVTSSWDYGIELTKPARYMRFWMTLQVLGLDCIDRMISHGFMLAAKMEQELLHRDWEVPYNSLAIVNFRFRPRIQRDMLCEEALDKLNNCISRELESRQVAAVYTSQIYGKVYLRACTINPQTTVEDIAFVVRELDLIARRLLEAFISAETGKGGIDPSS
ncbi:pyridoxal phosphate-dependent transferase [Penicillium cataractarum]|uniref:Pyridoxal phosphate-dependent transferase n=1 Tax=Penicillium cataractarum TaxID=2100454 RepID=A0A9W9SFB9_9EURO|nr:pyridoxal phosphate-dependent transferase [Penicillium cataractarum]KAJ5377601.1 pyridoxal phosphate-dependent transferase [Penicillium cataractarum]